jgi:DNA-directed RNA polymerase specialized sigma24 family protein
LLATAVDLIRRSGWRRRFDMNRKSAAEDLLHEAVLRAWGGPRQWNPEKVELWGFLVGVMKSLVYNSAHSPENKTSSLDEPLGDGGGTKADRVEHDTEPIEEQRVREQRLSEMEEEIITAAGNDAVLLKYVEAIMDGGGSPAEIAKRTGMAVTAVYQAHRKLCRRVEARKPKEESP